jgi:hypothetical protein
MAGIPAKEKEERSERENRTRNFRRVDGRLSNRDRTLFCLW